MLAHDSSAGPQTGVGLPNGVVPNRGGPTELAPTEEVSELRNSSFSDFRQNHRKTNFLRGFLKNPLVESVPGEHTQLFTEGFLVIFHEGLFSP